MSFKNQRMEGVFLSGKHSREFRLVLTDSNFRSEIEH